jgi:hypothetical protein
MNYHLNHEFTRLLQYGPWSRIYAIEPLIDHQTFKFFNFTSGFCQLSPHGLPLIAEWSLAVNFVNFTLIDPKTSIFLQFDP